MPPGSLFIKQVLWGYLGGFAAQNNPKIHLHPNSG
jgi:hypothetical protein